MYRFNGVVVVILSGLISDLLIASCDLRGQVVITVASVIALPGMINDSLL